MEKVEAFLALYQQLDEYLRRNMDQGQHLSFAQRLNVLAQKHPALKRNCELLKDYGNLRNLLVHHQAPGGGWIAEPSERALQEFERIAQAILSPEKLIPRFQKSGICTFSPQDSLVTELQHMREHDYSQVVVQTEKGLSLLTVEGMARWVEEKAQNDNISVQDAVVADAWGMNKQEMFLL